MTITDAVRDADLRVLTMCLFQITGDRQWLSEPYLPQRDVRLIAPEDAGFSAEVAAEITEAAIAEAGTPPAITDPGDELMVEMMSVCLGEPVPPEYAPMMREEMGFVSRDVEWPDGAERPSTLVIGAGASGIIMAARLARLGFRYDLVERGSSVGGVWRDNIYPGAGVDTPNHAYSFSFAKPNRWSRYFSPRADLEDYLQRTADDLNITPNIEFETTLTGASWDEAAKEWTVELASPAGPETRRYANLISAIGQLNVPKPPPVPGTDDFDGRCFHSSHWPTDLDLTGKRVAVIGTGASAMQIVPAIADQVAELTVYQRTAQWARPIPRYHDAIPDGSQWMFEHLPFYASWFRFVMLWRYGDGLLPLLRKDPEWTHAHSINKANERHRQQMADHIVSELDGRPDLIEKCMPTYPPYGKRILLDNGWFSAVRKPNVELVTDPIDRVDAAGVITSSDHREHDIIVLAHGFEVFQTASRLGLRGRNGVDLADLWANDDPKAYLGITVSEFPNLFIMQGPTTGLGHGGSAIFQAECHARHITACLAEVAAAGGRSIEVHEAPMLDYSDRHDAEHEQLIWSHPGMTNWYRNDAGRVVVIMPWRLVDYWSMTHDPDPDHYAIT
ncbi:MAG: flavin-containing monooxygenase [Ilumatobacter sp.]